MRLQHVACSLLVHKLRIYSLSPHLVELQLTNMPLVCAASSVPQVVQSSEARCMGRVCLYLLVRVVKVFKVAYGVSLFSVCTQLWLCRKCEACQCTLLFKNRARRLRLLCFIAAQKEQWAFFYSFMLQYVALLLSACREDFGHALDSSWRTSRDNGVTEWKQNVCLHRATFQFLCR